MTCKEVSVMDIQRMQKDQATNILLVAITTIVIIGGILYMKHTTAPGTISAETAYFNTLGFAMVVLLISLFLNKENEIKIFVLAQEIEELKQHKAKR